MPVSCSAVLLADVPPADWVEAFARISLEVTRPPGPLPGNSCSETPNSRAKRRVAGEASTLAEVLVLAVDAPCAAAGLAVAEDESALALSCASGLGCSFLDSAGF